MTLRLASVLVTISIALAACSDDDPPIEQTEPIVVVDGITSLYSIAADESAVYWSDLGDDDFGGTLYALDDGETEPREIRGITGDIPFADLIAATDHLVYVTTDVTDDIVAASPKTSGGEPRVMFEAGQPVSGPAARGDQAAWLALDSTDVANLTRALYRADLVTGEVTRLLDRPDANDVRGIAMDDTHIYWTEGDGIFRTDGSGVESFASTRGPIAIDDTDVYWRADGNLYRLARSAPGQEPTLLASGIGGGGALELDDDSVYFTRDGAIFSLSKQGDEPVEIGRFRSADEIPRIAVAPAGLYYGDRTAGKLLLIPRADR